MTFRLKIEANRDIVAYLTVRFDWKKRRGLSLPEKLALVR